MTSRNNDEESGDSVIHVEESADLGSPPVEVDIRDETFSSNQPRENTIPEKQERVRGALSLIFAGVFAAVILAPALIVAWAASLGPQVLTDTWVIIKDWLQLTLPAVTGIVGSAMGFYFGTRNKDGE